VLILFGLGAVVAIVVLGALRFARMDLTRERDAFARERVKDVVFEGMLTPREAKDRLPEALAPYAGDRVRITVQRLPDATAGRPAA
jgi:hypothetical protein